MTDLPLTRNRTSLEREEEIRNAVRSTTGTSPRGTARLATLDDAPALLDFFSEPRISDWIYSIPRPLTLETVTDFIAAHIAEREKGTGLLFVTVEDGIVVSYSDYQVWPEWGAGELTGAMHPDHQSKGRGSATIKDSFSWMFDHLKLDLLTSTAALDNTRTARLMEIAGFTYKGEIESERTDGTRRTSKVWELVREDWTT